MTITVDSITNKKLLLSKQIYDEALIRSSSRMNDVDMIMSVIGFDLSVETTLKTIYSSLESSRTPELEFQPLLQKTESLMKQSNLGEIPDQAHIQFTHSIRNDAQHKAKYPNISSVSDCRTYTRDFLQKILQQVYGLNFDDIRLTQLIKHEKIRDKLIKSEESLKNKDYETAIQQSFSGLNDALRFVGVSIVGRTNLGSIGFRGIVTSDKLGNQKVDEESYHAIHRMQETLRLVALGINFSDHMHFKDITTGILEIGDNIIRIGNQKTFTEQEAEFVVNYSINTVLQIEKTVGDLEKPFGHSHISWYSSI